MATKYSPEGGIHKRRHAIMNGPQGLIQSAEFDKSAELVYYWWNNTISYLPDIIFSSTQIVLFHHFNARFYWFLKVFPIQKSENATTSDGNS